MPGNAAILLPREDGVRYQFGAVVWDHHAGIAAWLGDRVQFASNAFAQDRVIDDGRQTLTANVTDHARDAEAPTVDQHFRHDLE